MVIVVMIDTVCTCMDIDARAATSPRHTDPPATVPFAIDFLSNACLTMYCLEFLAARCETVSAHGFSRVSGRFPMDVQ